MTLPLGRRWLFGAALGLGGACAAPPDPVPPRPTPPVATPTPPAPAASVARRPRPVAPAPLLENDDGVIGGERNETEFEFEPEAATGDVEVILDGVEPARPEIVRALQPYLELRRARLAGVRTDGDALLALTRLGEVSQAHQVRMPRGAREQVTFGKEPVVQASFVPPDGRSIVYRRDVGGDEDHQIFLLDLTAYRTTRLSDGKSRHGPFRIGPGGKQIAYTSNARDGVHQDLVVAPLSGGGAPRLLLEAEDQLVVLGWSRDGKQLLVQDYRSNSESTLALVDTKTGRARMLAPLEAGTAYRAGLLAPDGERVFVLSDRGGDFVHPFELRLSDRRWTPLTPKLAADVEEMALSGATLVLNVNVDGWSRMQAVDLGSKRLRELRSFPKGVLSAMRFTGKASTLAYTLTSGGRPGDVYTTDVQTGARTRWTFSEPGGLDPGRFVEPELVRAPSFDGLEVPALVYRPRGSGPFPVLLWMHGGPEGQTRPELDPVIQYFTVERGIAVVAPNIRGSDGYGKRFRSLDDGMKRMDSIRDVGAVLDWITTRSDLDAGKVGIYGVSYGGFVVLASMIEYADRIVAGCDVVGISNFVTFLENTREYRRDSRRAEYGDERDPEMRAFLEGISPLARAAEIRGALLVAHGANDPRVPAAEAEQVVDAVRAAGRPAWFFLAPDEGHGFRKRKSRDLFYRTMAEFFERHLVDESVGAPESAVEPAPAPEPDPVRVPTDDP